MYLRIATVAAALTALMACEKDKTDTGPLVIDSYKVTCAADGSSVSFEAMTSQAGFDGMVYAQETGSTYEKGGALLQYSDEHDLTSNGKTMSLTLTTGDLDPTRNESTLFTCSGHYEEDGWMTYAFAAYGEDGTVTDCLIGGGDPEGLKAGDYDAAAVNAPSFDLSACVVAQ